MCTGLEIAALAASAAGTGLGAHAQDQALKKQDRNAAEGILRQAQLSREANSRVRENINSVQHSDPNAETASNEAALQAALRNRQPTDTAPALGGSDQYAQDVSNAQTAGKNDIAGLVTNLSKIDAAQGQRRNEARTMSDTASKIDLLGLASRGQQFLTQLKSSSIRANPWETGVGSALQSAGTAMAARGGAPKKKLLGAKGGVSQDLPSVIFGGSDYPGAAYG